MFTRYKSGRRKGSAMLIMVITSIVLIAFAGISLTKLNSLMFRSIDTSNITRQAHEYASARADIIKGVKYADLQGVNRTVVDGSNDYYEEVLLGGEIIAPEDTSMTKRNMTINIYKGSESVPRASLVVPRYSGASSETGGQYVVNNAFGGNKNKKLALDVDGNNRFVAADDKGNSQKLLSNVTENYSGDLNNLVETGIFSGTNLGNAPDTGSYSIENIRKNDGSGVYINQRATNFSNNKTYIRQCQNGIWTAWTEFGGGGSGWKCPSYKNVHHIGGRGGSFVCPDDGIVVFSGVQDGRSVNCKINGVSLVTFAESYDKITAFYPAKKGDVIFVDGGAARGLTFYW